MADIHEVFDRFLKEAGYGPDNPKVVVADLGYYTMAEFLTKEYGLIKPITKRRLPSQDKQRL